MIIECTLNNIVSFKDAYLILILACFSFTRLSGQENIDTTSKMAVARRKIKNLAIFGNRAYTFNYKGFSQLYPDMENPTVGWQSSLRSDEGIILDFQPVLTLNLFNNYKKKLEKGKLLSMVYYLAFRPHFRIYNGNSKPVQMPSYRIFLGLQHLYRINERHMVSYRLESGHYSNGQSGCALKGGGEDHSDECDSVFALVTPSSNLSEMINRQNGNYSTNLTEITLNYRYISRLDEYLRPQQFHSMNFGIILYHDYLAGIIDFAGFDPNAIEIYGRWRFMINYSYHYNWRSGYRISVSEHIELIKGAHPWVNPFRTVTTATLYLPRHLGIYLSYTYGHDNYNLRFVDSGHQFGTGIVWDMFAPVEVGNEGDN